MSQRPRMRMSDLKTVLAALKQSDLKPCALDTLPDGTFRWHFTPPQQHDDNDLDRELAAFEAKHGYGRT